MIHPRNQCHKCSNRGDGPCPSPFYTLPQIGRNERYKITFSQEHATTKSGCSQSKILSASRHPRVYPRDGRTFWGSALPPFAAGAAKKMQRKQASPMKRRQKTRPLSHWRVVSGFYFPFHTRCYSHSLRNRPLSPEAQP